MTENTEKFLIPYYKKIKYYEMFSKIFDYVNKTFNFYKIWNLLSFKFNSNLKSSFLFILEFVKIKIINFESKVTYRI